MIGKYFALLLTIGAVAAIEKVPVALYYETLCQDSMTFFTKQFTPTWRDLKDYIDLKLVPYGKTTSITVAPPQNVNFTCHHGANECVGNKFQSCLISPEYNVNLETQINLIDCLMTSATKEKEYTETVKDCNSQGQTKVDTTLLISCTTTSAADRLLTDNGRKTDQIQNPLKSVPTIVFKNRFDEAESKAAEKSFRSTLCKYITDTPKPKACEASGASITTVGLITLFATGLVVRML